MLLQFSSPSFSLWSLKIMFPYLWDYDFLRGKNASRLIYRHNYLVEQFAASPLDLYFLFLPFVSMCLLFWSGPSSLHRPQPESVSLHAYPCLDNHFLHQFHFSMRAFIFLLCFFRPLIFLSFTKYSRKFSIYNFFFFFFPASPTNCLTYLQDNIFLITSSKLLSWWPLMTCIAKEERQFFWVLTSQPHPR